MSEIDNIENLAKNYITCSEPHANLSDTRSHFNEGQDNDCPKIFTGIDIKKLKHEGLSCLPYILTRTLHIGINSDHKHFWAWCGFLLDKSYELKIPALNIFCDDWLSPFIFLLHFLFASERRPQGYTHEYDIELRKYVNRHILHLKPSRSTIASPLVFALLEGLLRRKNKDYVQKDGIIIQPFEITRSDGTRAPPYEKGKTLSNVADSLRLLIQHTVRKRDRKTILGFDKLNEETKKISTDESDIYSLLKSRRDNFLHGNQYWRESHAIILNLICLLIIDEIEPCDYDNNLSLIIEYFKNELRNSPHHLYPPDLENAW